MDLQVLPSPTLARRTPRASTPHKWSHDDEQADEETECEVKKSAHEVRLAWHERTGVKRITFLQ